MLGGNDGWDDMHDNWWIVLIWYNALDEVFHGFAFLFDSAFGQFVLYLFQVRRVVAGLYEECASCHNKILIWFIFSNIINFRFEYIILHV